MARKTKREPRRKPGTGTIRHKPARTAPWEAEWQHAGGDREYRGFQSRQAATTWLDGLVEKREKHQDTTGGAQLFRDFIQRWLAIKVEVDDIAPKTLLTYKFYAELASGTFGDVRIDSLTLEHMQRLMAKLNRGNYKCTGAVFRQLSRAFAYARSPSLQWMAVNPLEGLKIPAVKQRENKVLTQKQRAKLLEIAAIEHDPDVPLLPLWHLYSRLAFRKGEGIALNWTDIDWEAKTITIDESITNVGPDNPRGETKGRRIRIAPLPDDIAGLLQAHQTAQRKRGIFPAIFVGKNGEPVTPQHVQYRWSLLRKKAGCTDTTLHDLRHTALYLMALDGVPENVRMALAGHASTDMSKLYANHASVEDVRRFLG
jgi:integrase